jgi:hypothetical protein
MTYGILSTINILLKSEAVSSSQQQRAAVSSREQQRAAVSSSQQQRPRSYILIAIQNQNQQILSIIILFV